MARLEEAVESISLFADIIGKSSIYETKPWGKSDQPNFLNMTIAIDCKLPPAQALLRFLTIESKMGRVRKEKWGQRNIDIDIILWNEKILDTTYLTIPHKHLPDRDFFLEPCIEIDSDVVDPRTKEFLISLLERLDDKQRTIIRRVDADL